MPTEIHETPENLENSVEVEMNNIETIELPEGAVNKSYPVIHTEGAGPCMVLIAQGFYLEELSNGDQVRNNLVTLSHWDGGTQDELDQENLNLVLGELNSGLEEVEREQGEEDGISRVYTNNVEITDDFLMAVGEQSIDVYVYNTNGDLDIRYKITNEEKQEEEKISDSNSSSHEQRTTPPNEIASAIAGANKNPEPLKRARQDDENAEDRTSKRQKQNSNDEEEDGSYGMKR